MADTASLIIVLGICLFSGYKFLRSHPTGRPVRSPERAAFDVDLEALDRMTTDDLQRLYAIYGIQNRL